MTDEFAQSQSQSQSKFSDRLLAVEPLPAEVQQHLNQELHAMFVRELNPFHRAFVGVVAVFALIMAGVCGYLAATESTLPTIARVGLATGTLFGLCWAMVAYRVCRRGTMDMKIDARRIATMVWVFTVLMMTFFLMVGMSVHDRLLGLMMIANGLAFLIGAGVYWLSFRIEQSELVTREKLLELELRIAQMMEKQSAAPGA